jgi:hypothetical protein
MASLARVTLIASRRYCSRKSSSRPNCGLSCQRCHVAFQRAPHLHHLQHALHGRQHGRVEGQGPGVVARGDEHAGTLAGREKPRGLELADRFADHRPRDLVSVGQLLFSGQSVAGRPGAVVDGLAQPRGELVAEAFGRLKPVAHGSGGVSQADRLSG